MKPAQFKHHRTNLHILSPIHVGTGQEFDPLSYIIRNQTLYLIDLMKWIENYPEKEKLHDILESDNFVDLRTFVASNFNAQNSIKAAIAIDCPKLLRTYQKAIKERDSKNQVLISPTIRNETDGKAYIPGSSIKGAIRTAIADRFVESARVTSKDAFKNEYNSKIFGRINNDPLRYLKLPDVFSIENGTAIVEATEYSKNPDKSLTPKGYFEILLSLCHTGEPKVFETMISLAEFELFNEKIDLNFLIRVLNRFYIPKFEEEHAKFYNQKRAENIQVALLPLNLQIAAMRDNEALIRIGHFSHVECVTLDNVRNPRTRRGKNGKPLPYGTTRTLANGLFPFGWAKLEFPDISPGSKKDRSWSFPLNNDHIPASDLIQSRFFMPEIDTFAGIEKGKSTTPKAIDQKTEKAKSEPSIPPEPETPVEKLLKELENIKPTDAGRIGTVMQKMENLQTPREKAEIALAIRDKIGPKAFKKHKRKDYLLELIEALE
jgi:CRISPR/Cas system CSM-associated protein Csm5 (group 7 of RAMP superfamily)